MQNYVIREVMTEAEQREMDRINRQVDMAGRRIMYLALFMFVFVFVFNLGRWIWSLI